MIFHMLAEPTPLPLTWPLGQSVCIVVESASPVPDVKVVVLEDLHPPGQLAIWLLEV